MPALPGLHEDGVRRVSLLQGHEEVWWTRPHEAVLPPETVHGGETHTRHDSRRRDCNLNMNHTGLKMN